MSELNPNFVSIAPLLRRLKESSATVVDIINAIDLLFQNKVSPAQMSSFLTILHTTRLDQDVTVIAECATRMRVAGLQVDIKGLHEKVSLQMSRWEQGSYRGGFCTIEGTGGDGHSTFNVSTAASILASSVLLIAKHGAGASSSKSGAADVLRAIKHTPPALEAVTPDTLHKFYETGSFAFLFSPIFHPGTRYVAEVRKELGFKTIFNILGPLAHPLNSLIEARVVGVAQRHLGPIYAQALKISGVKKALIVCGAEDLDEISCAGPTFCWRLVEETACGTESQDTVCIEEFHLEPADFGIPMYPLRQTPVGKLPFENAEILMDVISGHLPKDDPLLNFVLLNTAALFVIAGICENDIMNGEFTKPNGIITETGPGGGRWKEGMRRARMAMESGVAIESLKQYIETTRSLSV